MIITVQTRTVNHVSYLPIRLVSRKGYRSIAHEAKPNGVFTKESIMLFVTRGLNSPLVAKPIKMQDLH